MYIFQRDVEYIRRNNVEILDQKQNWNEESYLVIGFNSISDAEGRVSEPEDRSVKRIQIVI